MKRLVLIHASIEDAHALAVAECVRSLGTDILVLNRENYLTEWTASCQDDEVIFDTDDGSYSSPNVCSVLWRRDFLSEASWVKWEDVSSQARQFIAEQRCIHIESAFKRLASTCPFINSIPANRTCNSKVLQHHVARRCGLQVPSTYIGSNPAQAEQFIRTLWARGRRCCTKNLESTHLEIDGIKHARLTRLFTVENIPDLQGLPACPMIFQEYIEKRFEYRVTVVGKDVFACQIDSQAAGGQTAVDWRDYNIPLTPHYPFNLGAELGDKLVYLVKALGLTYGAIDLIESPQGEFFFLEINSMGQWLWIEDMTELPISMAIAHHLANPELILQ